jgi:hypothetical protein
MSDDLFQLLFVVAFILFGLLGGRKKPSQQPQQRPQPRPRPARQPPSPRPRQAAEPATPEDMLVRELESVLRGRRVPAPPEVPPPEEAMSLEDIHVEENRTWLEGQERAAESQETARWAAGRERAAESLETLQEADAARHERFHQKYALQPAAVGTTGPAFPRSELQRAIIWSEILAPPVSER